MPARDLVTMLGNLLDNAFDALGSLPAADVRRVRVTLAGTASAVVVTVEDSGSGLDDAAVTHALERGWTTKGSGEAGRGVGLALVAQVARRHGGDVEIGASELGGARFTVTLHAAGAPR